MRKYSYAFLLPLFACTLQAQSFTNGQAARAVIGQEEFTFGAEGASQTLVGGVSGLAYANHRLFVADSNIIGATPLNNRVLIFDTTQIPAPHADLTQFPTNDPFCQLCGYSAVDVLGQADYTDISPGRSNQPTPTSGSTAGVGSLNSPTAVASDGNILAVADTNNNRILIWNSIPTSIGQPATLVLGAGNFTDLAPAAATQNNFRGPQGVWIQNGKLFVADTQNFRVLIWNSIPTHNNQPADLVLGQTTFNSGSSGTCDPLASSHTTTASQLCNPVGVSSDGTRLFVADLASNRVLIWNSIPTSNNQPADVVIGQPDTVSAIANNSAVCGGGSECAASLDFPRFALSDGTHLYVADGGNDRVLIFNSIPTQNGASANAVLGQPDFTSDVDSSTNTTTSIASTAIDNTGSVDTIPSPMSLAWDGANLYVSDPFNRRVLVFTPADTSLPDNSVVNWASQIIRQEGIVTISLPATTGAIVANDTVSISIGQAGLSSNPTAYTYTIQSKDTLDGIAQALVSKINANGGDPNVTALFAGAGTASVYLSSKAVDLGFDTISLSATTSNSADITATASGGYLTSGTAATGSPGMLVVINGTNLSGNSATAPTSSAVPTSLGGVQVFMDGYSTPIFSVSPTQIVAQIPYSYTNNTGSSSSTTNITSFDRNSTSIYVRTVQNDGSVTITNATPVYIAPANPGLFSTAPGQPIAPVAGALHQSGNPTAVVSIDGSVHAGDTATITVNGRNYTYTVQSSDSLTSIAQGLINAINNAPDPQVTASLAGLFSRVILTATQGGAAGTGIPISGSTSSSASVTVTAYTNQTCCNVVSGSEISTSNPAVPGELITVNAAGLGLLSNSFKVVEGQPYNGPQPNGVSNEVVATLSGTTGQVINAGLAAGAVGTYQIQLVVPQSLGTNANTPLYVAQNAFISNTVSLPVGPAGTPITTGPTPTAPQSPIYVSIDAPSAQSGPYTGRAAFGGWALDVNVPVALVGVFIDGVFNSYATYGSSRPDVCGVYPASPNCPNVGWNFVYDTTQLADGTHTLQITVLGTEGLHFSVATTFTTANASASNPTKVFIDQPGGQSNPFEGVALFQGWAINDNAAITSVTLAVDGASLGSAAYGSSTDPRGDVCAAYGPHAGCPYVGWTKFVDTTKLANGVHTLSVTATAANGQHSSVASRFTVANWSTANPMVIDVDVPNAQSGAFSGVAHFGGWVIDSDAPVNSVALEIDGVSFGNAVYGGARTDVCNAFLNSPGCPNVGWNAAIDTTLLGDGVHTLAVTATTIAGQRSTITQTFTVGNLTGANALKIAIDSPSPQSSAFSGTSVLFGGWALSTDAAMSSVRILIDGGFYKTASYGASRADACAVYASSPNCANNAGVGWNVMVDTTTLGNGAHTLEVTGTSASGERATASASFTVSNAAPNGPMHIFVDSPGPQSSPFEGLASFQGWAINDNNVVNRVGIAIDGVPQPDATYGVSRPDVCSVFTGRPGCPNVGWSFLLDTTQLSDGTHTLDVTAYSPDGTHATVTSTFTVGNWATANPITVHVDAPYTGGGPYFGIVNFGGWALDQNGLLTNVTVAVDGVPFAGALYGINRSDVCAAYPGYANCPNVGWTISFDTTFIANGNHTLDVTATAVTGQSLTVTQAFTVAN